ncbi:hypothetical protein DFJ73DRAFT_852417 [Zopfochytrium polystomum]|nr:hypothetical protein DFJ73DRAFT_852417 [Zopfochytrium polystomum]
MDHIATGSFPGEGVSHRLPQRRSATQSAQSAAGRDEDGRWTRSSFDNQRVGDPKLVGVPALVSPNYPPLFLRDDRPEECPPCFDCHLQAFPCVHFSTCSDLNGKCVCGAGFGGDDCSTPLCDSLADGNNRHQKPGNEQYCSCKDGWIGNNCNVCRADHVCDSMIIGGQNGTCYSSSLLVSQNYMQCQVTNEGVVKNLKSAELTHSCNRKDGTCEFQFWVQGTESFYCAMTDCAFSGEQFVDKNVTLMACEHARCQCIPGRILCGQPGSIDLTDWMTDPEDGPTGPTTYTCTEVDGDGGNYTCKFEEPHMNDLISLISTEPYFTLSCVSGECLHVTQVPGYTRPAAPTAFTPLLITIMIVIGLGIVGAIVFTIRFFKSRSEMEMFDDGRVVVGDGGDEEIRLVDEDAGRRALMAGFIPRALMFRDISYTIYSKKSAANEPSSLASVLPTSLFGRARTAPEADTENAPLLEGGGATEVDAASEATPARETDRRKRIKVLESVHGYVKPGQVMAIMGGSGAGKTTFLDILARKSKTGKIRGEILVNGRTMSADEYKSIIGYVDQEDTLMGTLTVYETVMYSALLRLPRSMSYEAKKRRVQETMQELGIVHIANRRIGVAGSRGISGGEKRRVSIACELVTSPSILFLDEPTSGLDSYNAFNVIECLVSLARQYKRTVIFTIHQPRSNIYALFDQLVLLAKGKMIYSGPAQDAAIDHFSSMGYNCPLGFNLADYLVDLTMHVTGTSDTPSSGDGGTPERGALGSIRSEQEERLYTPHVAASRLRPAPSPLMDPLGATQFENDGETDDTATAPPRDAPNSPSSSRPSGFGGRSPTGGQSQSRVRSPPKPSPNGSLSRATGAESPSDGAASSSAQPPPFTTDSEPDLSQMSDVDHLETLAGGYDRSSAAAEIRQEITAAIEAAEEEDEREFNARQNLPRGSASRRSLSVSSFASTRSNRGGSGTAGSVGDVSDTRRATPWTQFQILSGRTFKNLYRNPSLLLTHYLISVIVAVMCGLLFWKVNNDIGGFQNRMGLFFLYARCLVFGFLANGLRSQMCVCGLIFIRERANRYYHPITYFTSKILFDMIPLRVVPPVILGLILYPLVGLRSESFQFLFKFLYVLVLFNMTAASCCMALSLVLSDASVATLVATLVMLFEMLFGGLLLNKGSVPPAFRWMQDTSFFNCALEALVVNEVYGLSLYENKFGLQIDVPGAVILQTFGFEYRNYWVDARMLWIMCTLFLTIGFLWLQFRVKERR